MSVGVCRDFERRSDRTGMNYIYGKTALFGSVLAGGILTAFLLAGCGNRAEVFLREADPSAEMKSTGSAGEEQRQTAEELPDAEAESGAVAGGQKKEIYVDLSGAVARPGVYCVPEGSRLFEVIDMAGGLCTDASEASVNRACIVSDGQKIVIPTEDEVREAGQTPVELTSGSAGNGKISLNAATTQELTALPGIGLSKAEAIIRYREENGLFREPDDLMRVKGIGEKKMSRLRDLITL